MADNSLRQPSSPDLTLQQGGAWESVRFTVPSDIPDEDVQARVSDKYMRVAGEFWEKNGFTVLHVKRPKLYEGNLPIDADRRGYIVWGWLKRRPVEHTIDVPEAYIPKFEGMGMKLT